MAIHTSLKLWIQSQGNFYTICVSNVEQNIKSKVVKVKSKLEKCRSIITECKSMAERKASESEDDSNEMMIWLNYKIELADIEYRLKDMLQYFPKSGE